MVATFTPQQTLPQLAQKRAAQDPAGPSAIVPDPRHWYPSAQFKGPVLYEGPVRATMPAIGGPYTFELLEGTYAGAGIVATDIIFLETGDLSIVGAWQVASVSDPSAELTPVDPSPDLPCFMFDGSQLSSNSYNLIVPNRARGRRDSIVNVRISAAIQHEVVNLRARGSLGFTRSTDNLRQLVFDGVVTGTWVIGDTVTGDSSGAVGTIVGLGQAINAGLGPDASGYWITVDMGLRLPSEAPLVEFDDATPESVTTGSTGATATLKDDPFGQRSTGVLFRPSGGISPYTAGLGTKLFATSGGLDFVFGGIGIKFPNAIVPQSNGIYVGDVLLFDDAPIAGRVFGVVDLVPGPGDPSNFRNVVITDPPHGQADGPTAQSPITIFYNPNRPETLLATGVEYDASAPPQLLITIADGRGWTEIGLKEGDNFRTKNSGNGNNFDLRAAQILTQNNPDDRLHVPGDSFTPFSGPYPDTFDVYKLEK